MVYPIALIVEIILSPITIVKFIINKFCGQTQIEDYSLKPPVGDIDLTPLIK